MKDTTPMSEFRPQFAAGALSSPANEAAASHGAEMDAPHVLPSGGWENNATCPAYPQPRQSRVCRS